MRTVDEVLDGVDEHEDRELKKTYEAHGGKRPFGHIEDVRSGIAAHEHLNLQYAAVNKSCANQSLNDMDYAKPIGTHTARELINKHVDPHMSPLDLEGRNGEHTHYHKEVRGKLIASIDRINAARCLTQYNVDGNNENHDKAGKHAGIVYAKNYFTETIADFFQGKLPPSKR